MCGGVLLSSTDHMIQHYGTECLGTCGRFKIRFVHDDPERQPAHHSHIAPPSYPSETSTFVASTSAAARSTSVNYGNNSANFSIGSSSTKAFSHNRAFIVRPKVTRGSSYAYLEGCPVDRGCTLLLRGASREVLNLVRGVISEALAIAYHLKLETCYYSDRLARLFTTYFYYGNLTVDNYCRSATVEPDLKTPNPYDSDSGTEPSLSDSSKSAVTDRSRRLLLSSSLDVDYRRPHTHEIVGYGSNKIQYFPKLFSHSYDPSLYIATILMNGNVQQSKVIMKYLRYYSDDHDLALGQFLLENCFQLTRDRPASNSMLDHCLSIYHRHARIDICVRSRSAMHNSGYPSKETHDKPVSSAHRTGGAVPISFASTCKVCPVDAGCSERLMSEEMWKMSFGKLLEILLYNRTGRMSNTAAHTGSYSATTAALLDEELDRYHDSSQPNTDLPKDLTCPHSIHDNHTLTFYCDIYQASIDVTHIHPFAVHVRQTLESPKEDYFPLQCYLYFMSITPQLIQISQRFLDSLKNLRQDYTYSLSSSTPEVLNYVIKTLDMLEIDITSTTTILVNEIKAAMYYLAALLCISEPFPINIPSGFDAQRLERYAVKTEVTSSSLAEGDYLYESFNSTSNELGETSFYEDLEEVHDGHTLIQSDGVKRALAPPVDVTATPPPSPLFASDEKITDTNAISVHTASSDLLETCLTSPPMVRRLIYERMKGWNQHVYNLRRVVQENKGVSPLHTSAAHSMSSSELFNTAASASLSVALSPDTPSPIASAPDLADAVTAKASALSSTKTPIPSLTRLGISLGEGMFDGYLSGHYEADRKILFEMMQSTLFDSGGFDSARDRRGSIGQNSDSIRLTKVLTQFVMGKESSSAVNSGKNKVFVDISAMRQGHINLKPGRKGEVIEVHREDLSTIVAYSLASAEYRNQLYSYGTKLSRASLKIPADEALYRSEGSAGGGNGGGYREENNTLDMDDDQGSVDGNVDAKSEVDYPYTRKPTTTSNFSPEQHSRKNYSQVSLCELDDENPLRDQALDDDSFVTCADNDDTLATFEAKPISPVESAASPIVFSQKSLSSPVGTWKDSSRGPFKASSQGTEYNTIIHPLQDGEAADKDLRDSSRHEASIGRSYATQTQQQHQQQQYSQKDESDYALGADAAKATEDDEQAGQYDFKGDRQQQMLSQSKAYMITPHC